VELFDFIFRLGVVFAIYGFLWGLIEIGFRILTSGRERSIVEVYLLRGIKYIFLADVTFLFCIKGDSSGMAYINQLIFAAIILLTYFVGKLQNNQNQTRIFQIMGPRMQLPKQLSLFNLKAEVLVISLSIILFVFFHFFPEYAANPISIWFHDSIINIEDTPVFGFIFKVIGFFFLLSMIFKMIGGITFLLTGGKPPTPQNPFQQKEDSDDEFDDYEEIN
jgi:hypothetical protein